MIITPAAFEDEMKEKKTVEDALALMVETLDSLGYSAGLDTFMELLEQMKK